jgi:hypothetical protein
VPALSFFADADAAPRLVEHLNQDPVKRREDRRRALENVDRPTPPDFVERFGSLRRGEAAGHGSAPSATGPVTPAPAEERPATKAAPGDAKWALPWRVAASIALIALALALVGAIVLLGQARDASRKAEALMASARAASVVPAVPATAVTGTAMPGPTVSAAPSPSTSASAAPTGTTTVVSSATAGRIEPKRPRRAPSNDSPVDAGASKSKPDQGEEISRSTSMRSGPSSIGSVLQRRVPQHDAMHRKDRLHLPGLSVHRSLQVHPCMTQ